MGVFAVFVVIGAGVAYYLDPAAISGVLGISTAQTDAVADTDVAALDDASSSLTLASDTVDGGAAIAGDESISAAPSSAKKTKAKKTSAAKSVEKAAPTNTSGVGAVTNGVLSDGADAVASSALSSDDDAAPAKISAPASAPSQASATACSFPGAAPAPTRKVIFNEIAWMGSPSSSNAEWMELKNRSASKIDLSGWELIDGSGKIKITFGSGDALAPGGLLLLSRAATGGGASGRTYSGDLVNAGDELALMDVQCAASDYLDASYGWPGGNNTTKQTLERNADGLGWHTSASPGGTPGAENSVVSVSVVQSSSQVQQSSQSSASAQYVAPVVDITPTATDTTSSSSNSGDAATAITTVDVAATTTTDTTTATSASSTDAVSGAAHVLISVVQISAASSSNDLITLYNPTASTADVSGWRLRKRSQTGTDYSLKEFPAGSAIAAGQTFTWANSSGGFSEAVGANVASTETLATDNSVALFDAAGNIVDAVAWGTGSNQYGEGPPFSTNPTAGQTLTRRSANGAMVDTDNNINDFIIQ